MHVQFQDHGHLGTLNFARPHSPLPPELYYQIDNVQCSNLKSAAPSDVYMFSFLLLFCKQIFWEHGYTFCKSLFSFILDSYADLRILLNVAAALLKFIVYGPADLEFSFEHSESIG
jgi:hypothetical protein